jgi:uncharacterized surface protein with fasciclin (FAS1) repeats
MSEINPNRFNRLAVILGLTMALGPLTALSLGSKYAGEETRERAQAGVKNIEPQQMLDPYGSGDGIPSYATERSIGDILAGAAIFKDFEDALKATANDEAIRDGAYTVLVPSNEAFDTLSAEQRQALMENPEVLRQVVANHIIPGRYTATDLMQMREARTLAGNTIPVGASQAYDGRLGAGGAEVVKSNIFAANGVVHVIDRPIL